MLVIHLAARAGVRPSLENPHIYVETNVGGTTNLMELARLNGVEHFVYASSSSVYGGSMKNQFSDEEKVSKSDFVINNIDLKETKKEVLKIHSEILQKIKEKQ